MPPTSEPPEEQAVTLDALSEAFAEVLGQPKKAETAPETGPGEEAAESTEGDGQDAGGPESLDQPEGEEPGELNPRTILEAMLFVGSPGGEPLTPQRAAELMRGVQPGEVPDLVEELNRQYAAGGCPYQIVSEGPGYRMTLRSELAAVRNRFFGRVREARLSQAALDVLAIVAYRQPISGDDVTLLRGTPSAPLLSQLVRRRLLRIERTEEKPRRTRYYTTERFLQLFHLESLSDLPQSEDLDGR
jgi:segregation and condensation protein B